MARIARCMSESNIYHLTARGVGMQNIFEDDHDNAAFFERLKTLCDDSEIEVLAWCFMGNHFDGAAIINMSRGYKKGFVRPTW